MAVRQDHLDRNDGLRDRGNLLYVDILDDGERMIGSCMIFDFPTRQDLDEWLKQEPYVFGDVWRKIEISNCRTGPSLWPYAATDFLSAEFARCINLDQ